MKKVVLTLIVFYQKHLRFLTDATCRFTPSCSEYMYQAIQRYGILKGLFLGIRRILRCQPWSKAGIDLLK